VVAYVAHVVSVREEAWLRVGGRRWTDGRVAQSAIVACVSINSMLK